MFGDIATVDMPYMLYRGQYATHRYGLGIPGVETTAALDSLELKLRGAEEARVQKYAELLALSKDKNGNPRPLRATTSNQLRFMFDLLGIEFKDHEQAVKLIRQGFYKDTHGLDPNMTYADVVRRIQQSLEDEYVRRARLARAQARAAGRVEAAPDVDVVTGDPRFERLGVKQMSDFYALMKHIKKVRRTFKDREYSARVLQRKYDTYAQAYKERGLLPEGIGLPEALDQYATDISKATLSKTVLNQFVLTSNAEGAPLVIPVPDMGFEGHGILEDVTWDLVADRLVTYLDVPRPEGTSREVIAELVSKHVRRFSQGYTEVKTNHISIERFYALKRADEDVIDLFAGGEAAGYLKHLVDDRFDDSWGLIRFLEHVNSWQKMLNVQFSAFFAVAGLESTFPMTGTSLYKPSGWKRLRSLRRMYKANHPEVMELLKLADENRMMLARRRNVMGIQLSGVERDIDKIVKRIEEHTNPTIARHLRQIIELPKTQTDIVFDNIFNTLKLYVMQHFIAMENQNKANVSYADKQRAIAKWRDVIEASLGGHDFNEDSWATPKTRQILNLTMFSPQWTISVLNQMGSGVFLGPVIKNYQNLADVRYLWFRLLPLMTIQAVILAPAALQAAVYAAFGDGDDEKDTPWMWMNEEGRRLMADITPAMRKLNPLYEGEPTGRRRVYLRWGKQVYESARWFEDPMSNITSKASPILRLATELATGETLGYDWDLGFKNMGLAGWFVDGKGTFLGSRVGHVAKSFAPFSVLSFGTKPDAGLVAMLGPTAKGMPFGRATQTVHDILKAYADEGAYDKIHANPRIKSGLEIMLAGTLDAAARNGYNAAKVLDTGRGMVLRDLYAEYYKNLPHKMDGELSERDLVELEKTARKIMRVNGTVDGLRQSVKGRDKNYGQVGPRSPEQLKAMRESFVPSKNYGPRPDGTPKGRGFLGALPIKGGGVATEYSMDSEAVKVNGKKIDFPTLVPTLTKAEVELMVNDIIPNRKRIPDDIAQKAVDHALKRLAEGKSVFAD